MGEQKKPRILIAEDEEDWREKISFPLENEGCSVFFAKDWKETRHQINNEDSFDLICMNVLLRGEITESWLLDWTTLLSLAQSKKTKVIVITSMEQAGYLWDIISEMTNYKDVIEGVLFKKKITRNILLKKIKEIIFSVKPSGKASELVLLDHSDRLKLSGAVANIPLWKDDGPPCQQRKGLLRNAGLPDNVVTNQTISGHPHIAATDLIDSDEKHTKLDMQPEQFCLKEEVTPLSKILEKVFDTELDANAKKDFLQAAEAYQGSLKQLPLSANARRFATALVAKFKNYSVTNKQLDYHPMLAVLSHLSKQEAEYYSLNEEDTNLINTLLQRGKENIRALKARSAAGRVECPKGTAIGSGVLIGKNTLLTCAHVIQAAINKAGAKAWVRFNYKEGTHSPDTYVFALNLRSLKKRKNLDFALIQLNGEPEQNLAAFPYTPAAKKLYQGNAIRLIHHPNGNHVIISEQSKIIQAGDDYIEHAIPSDAGSSGAPIFDEGWNLVAIHRGLSIERHERGADSKDATPISAFYDEI